MIDINIYESQTCKTVSFGRKGENLARRILFDLSALIAEFGDGDFNWVVRRPHETDVYIALGKEQNGNTAILNLTATETAISGYGGLELRYYVDDVIVKTIVWRTSIAASLGGGDVPDPIEDYIDQMREIAQEASESADAAGESATQAAVSEVNAAGSATEAAGYAANAAASAGAAAGSATDSAASASAASTSAAQAAASASAADASAQDIAASAAQIQTNADDITDLKNQITTLEGLEKSRGFTPEQIQIIAAGGHADDYFSIGDIIYINWTDYTPATPVTYSVPHVVVHFGDIEDENGNVHNNAMWLMWMYATPQAIQFDNSERITETETTFQDGYYYYVSDGDGGYTEVEVTVGDTIPEGTTYYKHVRSGMAGRLRYGSNDWSQSAYRQWLNSDGGKGEWWTAQHDSDVVPDQANTVPGFLTGYTDDWKAIFKPIKVVTALNTACDGGVDVVTYDKFFLPSLEQMYGSPQKSGVEGDVWEYWIEETGLPSRSNGSSSNTNPARQIPSITAPDGAAVTCRLRSAYRSSASSVWGVNTAGYLHNYGGAANAYRALPACVIY